MFNLYDKVIIKSKNLPGTIVDIVKTGSKTVITVESDIKGNAKTVMEEIFHFLIAVKKI